MKRGVLLMAVVLLGTASLAWAEVDPAVLQAENARIAAMAKAKPTVLAVFAPSGKGGGSGVVISPDGYALTNFHVVKPCGSSMKCGMADGKLYDAVIVGVDPTGDVALIKLFGRADFPAAEMADSDQVQPGDWAFAMGNPFLLATDFQPTVTYGIISGTHRYQYPAGTLLEYTDCIQTDASINPGNSGGPLFDGQGRLIGINGRGSFEKRGRVNVGVGYAISINQIKNFLGYLRSGRIVDHATLGATVAFDDEGRVVVSSILDGSDAYRRGLRYDDEIIRFGGRLITTPNGFKNVLGIIPKGWRIPLSYVRDGQQQDIMVRLAGVHRAEELIQKTEGRRRMPIQIPKPKPKETPKDGEKPAEKPEPKPKEKPEDGEKPAEKPRIEKRQIPVPRPGTPGHPPVRAKAPLPKIVKEHFEAKRGFANYYYNKLNRDRIWKAWLARGDYSAAGGTWTLEGKLESGTQFELSLTNGGAQLKLPTNDFKWTASDELGNSLEPPNSGGMLPALHLWRRLAILGPGRFGDVYYLGTAPLAGVEKPVDVLVGIHAGIECRFMFDSAEGHLLALEFYADEDTDPCEVSWSGYREVDGRHVPAQMEVRYGDILFGIFTLDELRFEDGPSPEDAAPVKAKTPEDKTEKPDAGKTPGPVEEPKKAE